MKDDYIKLGIGLVLFLTWVGLVVFKVQGADDLINKIQMILAGLAAYYLHTSGGDRAVQNINGLQAPTSPVTPTTPPVPPTMP